MQCTCVILSSVGCSALQYFSTLFHKRYNFRGKKKLLSIKGVFSFSLPLWYETFLILRGSERDFIIYIYIGLHVKYQLFLSGFNETWVFSTDFRKILSYQISRISVYLEPNCFMWTDGQTDRHDKANSRFLQFRERP